MGKKCIKMTALNCCFIELTLTDTVALQPGLGAEQF